MQLILPLKHWQLFLILLFFVCLSMLPGYVGVVAGLIVISILLAWFWSIGTYGQTRFASKGITSTGTGFFTFNIIYLLLFSIVMTIVLAHAHDLHDLQINNTVLLGLCQGYAIFALLYSVWFAARTLSVSVNDGKFSWGSTIKHVFNLLLPIIGIWEIQPIVNRWSP